MTMKKRCLRLLDQVHDAARRPESAYALRSRIGRLLLACLRLAARSAGAREPVLPTRFELDDGAPQEAIQLVEECNRLLDLSATLVQPSEPLDERWTAGWERLEVRLRCLEAALARA